MRGSSTQVIILSLTDFDECCSGKEADNINNEIMFKLKYTALVQNENDFFAY